MSADNEIFVAEFSDHDYRVAELTSFYGNDEDLFAALNSAPSFSSLEEAQEYAEAIYDEIFSNGGYVEYGISLTDLSKTATKLTPSQ